MPKAKGKVLNWISQLQVWASDKVLRTWIPAHFSWFLQNDVAELKGHPSFFSEIIRYTDMLKADEQMALADSRARWDKVRTEVQEGASVV